MCCGGGPVITVETSWLVKYHCNNCGKMFKAMGKKDVSDLLPARRCETSRLNIELPGDSRLAYAVAS